MARQDKIKERQPDQWIRTIEGLYDGDLMLAGEFTSIAYPITTTRLGGGI